VIHEGVRLVQEREARHRLLDAVMERGLVDIKAGHMSPAHEVFDQLEPKFRRLAAPGME
jgi:hypothetical protein